MATKTKEQKDARALQRGLGVKYCVALEMVRDRQAAAIEERGIYSAEPNTPALNALETRRRG